MDKESEIGMTDILESMCSMVEIHNVYAKEKLKGSRSMQALGLIIGKSEDLIAMNEWINVYEYIDFLEGLIERFLENLESMLKEQEEELLGED